MIKTDNQKFLREVRDEVVDIPDFSPYPPPLEIEYLKWCQRLLTLLEEEVAERKGIGRTQEEALARARKELYGE